MWFTEHSRNLFRAPLFVGALVVGLLSVLFLAGCLPEVTPTVTPSAGHGPDTTRTTVTIGSTFPATASLQPITSRSASRRRDRDTEC